MTFPNHTGDTQVIREAWFSGNWPRALQGSSSGVSAFHLIIGSYLAVTEFLANATLKLVDISWLPLDDCSLFCRTGWSRACIYTFLATIKWAYRAHNLETKGIERQQEDITTIQANKGYFDGVYQREDKMPSNPQLHASVRGLLRWEPTELLTASQAD